MKQEKKSFTVAEIREKLAQYCVYQDRCHWEVEQKMREFTLIPEAKDEILIYLIQQKFLNEERFTKSFARGKFYQKKWGKVKIANALKLKQIPPKLIEVGLKEINANDYFETLEMLYNQKLDSLASERDSFKKKAKIKSYLLQKGFEVHLIHELLFE